MRHAVSGAPYLAAETFGGSVVNGGDGWHAHPTQALLDLYTMRSRLPGGSVEGRKVVILGDVLHSRVARSNIWSLTAAGADVWLCGPATLLRGFEAWAGCAAPPTGGDSTSRRPWTRRCATPTSSWRCGSRRERMASGLLPSLREYAARYGLTAERLALARPGALVMHPGPMNEGVEIAPDVAAGAQSRRRGAGPERRGRPDGAALPARRGARLMAWLGARGVVGRRGRGGPRDLAGRGWSTRRAGREGPGEIVVTRRRPRVGRLARRRGRGAGSTTAASSSRPGFIDLHAHFREPGNEDAETIASGLAAAAHGGFTTVCLMPNTTPALDDPAVLARVQAAAGGVAGRRSGPWRTGRCRPGRAGETLAALGELADAGVVGFSDDGSPVGVRRSSCGTRSPTPARSGCRSSTTPRTRP